ncbi:MAG: DUF1206 domain-containing protein [Gemmatimonadota bacterium]|nr:DUF1206 domain-containing protein [Gemmatimonadota bacterium]
MTISSYSKEAASSARGAARDAAPWVERLARLGYGAKGIVYLVIGLLAAKAAFGSGGRKIDQYGAIRSILDQPFGRIMLGIVATGLIGYALWRFVSAATDADRHGGDAKGIAFRLGDAWSGLVYGALGVQAMRLLTGTASGGGGATQDHWTARVMQMPMGRWLVGLAGAGVIAYGIYQLYLAVAGDVREHLDLSSLSADTNKVAVGLGRFGIGARAVIFGVVGWFFIRAALQYDPRQASDISDALRILEQSSGAALLGGVAIGLMAYGLFQLVKARYRRIRVG